MRKILAIISLAVASSAFADEQSLICPVSHIEPSYLCNGLVVDGWDANWEVGIEGGASTFVGSPVGCNDMFGRMKLAMRGYVAKWFTPSVGARLTFDGLRFKDSDNFSQNYQSYHMDLMWNVFGRPFGNPIGEKWRLSPYFGAGFLHTKLHAHDPFGFYYGVQGSYRVNDRLNVNVELAGVTTSSNFDGFPGKHRFADNLFSLTAGVSYSIGKVGWSRVIDARPYMMKVDALYAKNLSLAERVCALDDLHNRDSQTIEELMKILCIEGLLDKYRGALNNYDSEYREGGPKNNYSGLNSLRARLRAQGIGLTPDEYDNILSDFIAEDIAEGLTMEEMIESIDCSTAIPEDPRIAAYLKNITEKHGSIGAPVCFFFKIGTSHLTDDVQLINLDALARVALKYNLKVRVSGAADSATGNPTGNYKLSVDRANLLKNELTSRGVSAANITTVSLGGVDKYPELPANRQACVELHF